MESEADFINYDWSTLAHSWNFEMRTAILSKMFKRRGVETVTVRMIDKVINEQSIQSVDLLKSDTQGFDLQVLKGASHSLGSGRIKNVMIELNFAALYHGQSNPIEIMSYLRERQFRLVDLYEKVFDGNHLACAPLCSQKRGGGTITGLLTVPPFVSILIPCFNAERWIAQAIDSALAQRGRKRKSSLLTTGRRMGVSDHKEFRRPHYLAQRPEPGRQRCSQPAAHPGARRVAPVSRRGRLPVA